MSTTILPLMRVLGMYAVLDRGVHRRSSDADQSRRSLNSERQGQLGSEHADHEDVGVVCVHRAGPFQASLTRWLPRQPPVVCICCILVTS